MACIDEVEVSDDIRCVVWRAEGEVFTGGVDVNVFQKLVDADEGRDSRTFGQLLGAVRRLEALPMPTLALVHGLCLTAGWEVVARLRHDLGERVGEGRGWSRASWG